MDGLREPRNRVDGARFFPWLGMVVEPNRSRFGLRWDPIRGRTGPGVFLCVFAWSSAWFAFEGWGAARDPLGFAAAHGFLYAAAALLLWVSARPLVKPWRLGGFWPVMWVGAASSADLLFAALSASLPEVPLVLTRLITDTWPIIFALFLSAPKSRLTWTLLLSGYGGYALFSLSRGIDGGGSALYIGLAVISCILSAIQFHRVNWARRLPQAALLCLFVEGASRLVPATVALGARFVFPPADPMTFDLRFLLGGFVVIGVANVWADGYFNRLMIGDGIGGSPVLYVRPLLTICIWEAGSRLAPAALWTPPGWPRGTWGWAGAALVAASVTAALLASPRRAASPDAD